MTKRRSTIAELRWPQTTEFVAAASKLSTQVVGDIIAVLWKGYDAFFQEVIVPLEQYEPGDEMERSLTQQLYPFVQRSMTGFEPYWVGHAVCENETRAAPPAQAPEYDLAFVLMANPRLCWPVEAKVLATDRTIAEYTREIREQFLTCRYAPFSASGAMLAYLLAGNPDRLLVNIEADLGVRLSSRKIGAGRHHRTSDHHRAVPAGKPYPTRFRCHHLVMPVRM